MVPPAPGALSSSRQRQLIAAVLVVALVAVGFWLATRPRDHGTTGTEVRPSSTPSASSHATKRSAPISRPASGRPSSSTQKDPASGLPVVPASSLPREAQRTIALIHAGGPFPYPRNDGVTYRNLNDVLPQKSRNYYKEFTVPTPGAKNRGARRIVQGQAGEMYYTPDHYDSFQKIEEGS